jgi:hypothetical protein
MTDVEIRGAVDTREREDDRERRDAIELFLQLCDLDEDELLEALERLDTASGDSASPASARTE